MKGKQLLNTEEKITFNRYFYIYNIGPKKNYSLIKEREKDLWKSEDPSQRQFSSPGEYNALV